MAASAQPANSRPRSLAIALAAVVVVALGLPAGASAHSGAHVKALDYQAQVTSLGRGGGVMSARSLDGDRKLELSVAPAATVLVLGYAGEPFLRFSPKGVEVNERSPSAIANKVAKGGLAPALNPHATPTWSSVSVDHRYAWHDHRLGPIPGRSYPEGAAANWSIPIVVDGRPDRISGRLLYESGPPLWPWIVLLVVTVATALLAARFASQRLVETTLFIGASVAGVAAVTLTTTFGFAPGGSASAAWTNLVVYGVITVAALSIFARVPSARQAVAGFVAVLAVLVGLSDAAVLVRGFVISPLSAAVVRAATGVALSAGLIAAVCGAALLFRDDRSRHTSRRRKGPVQVVGLRGRAR